MESRSPAATDLTPLVERARAGDDHALDALLVAIEPVVQRFGRRLCRQDDDADDVKQDTLLALAQHLGDFEARSSLTSWVFALARSACVRRRRGLKNRPHASTDDLPEAIDAARAVVGTSGGRPNVGALVKQLLQR